MRVRAEGEWPGSRTQLVDPTDLGKYFFDVIDPASNRVLYSRGFASIYGEWETTPEFRRRNRTFHESVRFPWPDAPVRVAIRKRDPQNVFKPLWDVEVDPRSVGVASTRADCVQECPKAASPCCSRADRRAARSTSC